MRLEQACSTSSNLAASRKAWTRPCVGSCEVSMDALLTCSSQASGDLERCQLKAIAALTS